MISAEANKELTEVGQGTPMGDLLRRYWMPVVAIADFHTRASLKVRILGEDLVAFRDKSGRYGLIQEQCAHRKCSLAFGLPDDRGLRCPYHGWLYDSKGACLEQPAEPEFSRFRDRIQMVAYPVKEMAGLLFGYFGPDPAPLLPRYDVFSWDNALRHVGRTELPVNWVQAMENSMDPTHLEWLHGKLGNYELERLGQPLTSGIVAKHIKIGFDLFEYGIIKRRIVEGRTEDDEEWRIGHPIVFPNMLRVGRGGVYGMQIRVPIDETNTRIWWYATFRAPGVRAPEQVEVPVFEVPYIDKNGDFVLDTVEGQDMMAWITQGLIVDRTTEHVGTSDKGVLMYRKLLFEQAEKALKGEDPMGIIRDESANECIVFPQEENLYYQNAEALELSLRREPGMRYSPIADDVVKLFSHSYSKVDESPERV